MINKHPDDALGGSEIQCDIISKGLSGLGHDVFYLAVGGKEKYRECLYSIIPVKSEVDSIFRAVSEICPDIVYWRSNRSLAARAINEIRKFNVPVVFAVSNRYDLLPSDAFMIYKKKLKAVSDFISLRKQLKSIKTCDAVTVLNPEYKSLSPVKNTHAVTNAMEDVLVPFSWPRPYCVWIANLKDLKRPDEYIRLARELSGMQVDFLMVGRMGAGYEWIKNSDQTPENFFYLGEKAVDEANGIIESSLFHVHTCYPEGFGNIFIQAWMYGKPSVSLSFDPGGYIKKYNAGIVAGDDFSSFASSVEKLIKEEETRDVMGKAARRIYDEHHRPDVLARRVEKVLLDVVMARRSE